MGLDRGLLLTKGVATGTTIVFLAILHEYLTPGFTWGRLAVFSIFGGSVVLAAYGIVRERPYVGASGVCLLLLGGIGIPTVLGIFTLPTAGVLFFATLVIANRQKSS